MYRAIAVLVLTCSWLPLAAAQSPGSYPVVLLSDAEQEQVTLGVGKSLPQLSLPTLDADAQPLVDAYGRAATVVVWYGPLDRQAKTLLRDLTPDVITPFDKRGVKVLTIAVGDDPQTDAVRELGYEGAIYRDAAGEAFAQVGSESLPRVYVLDAKGNIVWLDIEYSESTRRELAQTLKALLPSE